MEQQEQRSDYRSTVMWVLVAAVGFLGGWVVHDELSSTAAATIGQAGPAAVPLAAAPAAAPAAPVVIPVVVSVAPASPGAGGTAVSVTTAPYAAVAVEPDAAPLENVAEFRPATSAAVDPPAAHRAGAPAVDTPALAAAPGGSTSTTWNVVVASDGSVVLMGAHGRLLANTGDSSGGASVALDADASLIQTGASDRSAAPAAAVAGSAQVPPVVRSGAAVDAVALPVSTGSETGVIPGAGDGEDHSVHVTGHGQVVTTDDSNTFLYRDGQINSNTGDTDSSAVNVLDVTRSTIHTGSSAGVPDEPGEDEIGNDEQAAASADDAAIAPAVPVELPDVENAAELQNNSVHVTGTRNAVTQDDSSLVLGGTGRVNAQAGDSDTAGVVAMDVHDSDIATGCAGTMCPTEPAATP